MKLANVVEVRDVTPHRSEPTPKRSRIEALLERYPAISDSETAEIRHFLATASHLDVGLLGGNEALSGKLAAFKKAHKRQLGLKLHEIALFLFVTVGPVAILFWRYLGSG